MALYHYRARWYDPVLGRFVQADTIVPEPGNPQALNRYSYVLNNPVRYSDPSGHDPLDLAWEAEFRKQHGRKPTDQDRYLRLLSLLFRGTGINGAWTHADWERYTTWYENVQSSRGSDFAIPGYSPSNSLESFAGHLRTLSQYYKADEAREYVRAIALLWAGVSYSGSFQDAVSNIFIRNMWRRSPLQQHAQVALTPQPMLVEGNTGWDPAFVDDTNPSHHYALFLASGFFMGYTLSVNVNAWRDADNPPDILLGNAAAAHGSRIRLGGPGAFWLLASWLLADFGL